MRASLLRRLAGVAILVGLPLSGHAACVFFGGGGAINFGSLDPSLATVRTAFADVRVLCLPVTPITWSFAGSYGVPPNLRMKHVSQNDYIAYSVGPAQTVGGLIQTWRITATILPAAYQNAFAGSYSDTLIVTINP
jgi:spore coat protein U-like protein